MEVLSNLHQAGENEQAHVGGPVFRSAPNQPKMRALLVYMNKTEAIENIFNYDWPSDEQLVDFAERSTGFGGDDGYYGILYPEDLDEYDKKVNGDFIPEGFIEIYYWNGPEDIVHVEEQFYLQQLLTYLKKNASSTLVTRVELLITSLD